MKYIYPQEWFGCPNVRECSISYRTNSLEITIWRICLSVKLFVATDWRSRGTQVSPLYLKSRRVLLWCDNARAVGAECLENTGKVCKTRDDSWIIDLSRILKMIIQILRHIATCDLSWVPNQLKSSWYIYMFHTKRYYTFVEVYIYTFSFSNSW